MPKAALVIKPCFFNQCKGTVDFCVEDVTYHICEFLLSICGARWVLERVASHTKAKDKV